MLTGVLYSCENVGLSHIHPDVTPAVNLQRPNLLNRETRGSFHIQSTLVIQMKRINQSFLKKCL